LTKSASREDIDSRFRQLAKRQSAGLLDTRANVLLLSGLAEIN
jgi:hypothetical protein